MPSRSRPRRSAAAKVEPDIEDEDTIEVEAPPPSFRSRSSRSRKTKVEPEPEPEVDEDEDAEGEDEEVPEPGPSRRSRARPKPAPRASTSRRAKVEQEEDEEAIGEDDNEAEPETPPKRMRARKSVSYKEIPAEADLEPEVAPDEEDEDGEGEEVDEEDDQEVAESARKRRTSRAASSATPAKKEKPVFEKIGSGRGGFSVKGAAAAAARARWAKVRREKAERGEDSDDERPARRRTGGAKRNQARAPDEPVPMGATLTIKGREYTMGDDELVLPDNEKGDTKIDAEGRLQGGREYKVVTFTSEGRRDPEKIYALTIDAARACGYTDSLAFLRRCPQIVKLACSLDERQMLIDIGRVSGNLKHRTVTMVSMRNIFKVMGARVIKGGKWVTDDYDEEEALAKCAENGFTPYTEAHEEEIAANAVTASQPNRQLAALGADRSALNLTPFYQLGGPSTHFGGNGIDPWSEAGWGSRRTKLRGIGVSAEDWMLKTAEECRRIDLQLREYREERLLPLASEDATRGWVYALEASSSKPIIPKVGSSKLAVPAAVSMERNRSALSNITVANDDEEALTPLPQNGDGEGDGDVSMEAPQEEAGPYDHVDRTDGGRIVVQSVAEEKRGNGRYNWGLGSWTPGSIYATYEPHTHIPHVPLSTQPQQSARYQVSPSTILVAEHDSSLKNFAQTSVHGPAAKGLASVEYVFETRPAPPSNLDVTAAPFLPVIGEKDRRRRLQEVIDALKWEHAAKRKRKLAQAS